MFYIRNVVLLGLAIKKQRYSYNAMKNKWTFLFWGSEGPTHPKLGDFQPFRWWYLGSEKGWWQRGCRFINFRGLEVRRLRFIGPGRKNSSSFPQPIFRFAGRSCFRIPLAEDVIYAPFNRRPANPTPVTRYASAFCLQGISNS